VDLASVPDQRVALEMRAPRVAPYDSAPMARTSRFSIVPAAAALAALFIVLPQGGADAEVGMTGTAEAWVFSPASVEIEPGDRVAFINETSVTHSATCEGCPWDAGDVQPGETVMVTFDEEVSSRFFCRYHGAGQGMVGQLLVGDAAPPGPAPTPIA